MTSSELYHGFGVEGYRTVRTEFVSRRMVLHLESTRPPRCACCGSGSVVGRGRFERRLKSLPIGAKQVDILLRGQRVECQDCGEVRRMKVDFAEVRVGYTKRLEKYVLWLLRKATMKDVAELVGLGWDAIKDIQKRHLTRRYRRPRLKGVRRIAIDEISIGKGHRYVTVVLNLENGMVLFVGDGKGAEALTPFWRRVKRCKGCRLRAIAIDMSPAYISAVQSNAPKARIVFDRFHLVKLCNEMLTKLRRALYNKIVEDGSKSVLKGVRWLLLKNPENLDEAKDERRRLNEALELNRPLATAYYMKDELRQLWNQPGKAAAQKFLNDWMKRAEASGITLLKKFAHTLAAHKTGILAWYDDKISTGPLEGTNNKIKTMKRQAYGFRDTEFLKLKIMALHETKYALIG
jgi:transposase